MTYFSDTLPARRKALVDLYTAATGRKQEKVEAVRTALGVQFGETPTFYQVTHEVRKARKEGALTDGLPTPPKQQETACLVLTDLHYGRKTASFTPDVCKDRLTRLGERLIRIKTYLKGYEFDGLRVFLLGDVNDGTDIYKTQAHHQAETNVDKQAHDLTTLLADWLAEQKKVWKSVQVDAVPGNHGRGGKSVHEAANWDIVAYRYLALKCEKHAIPVGLSDAENVFMRTVTVRGHRYLLYHGHDIHCFPAGTMVYLPHGAQKVIQDIKPGDFIQNGKRDVAMVDRVHREAYRGQLVVVEARNFPKPAFRCTPDHQILGVKQQATSNVDGRALELDWIPAKYLSKGDYVAFARPPLPQTIHELYPSEIPLHKPKHHKDRLLSDVLPVNEDLGMILGWYLGDGSVSAQDCIEVVFGKEEEDWFGRYCDAVERLCGVRPTRVNKAQRNCIRASLYHKRLASVLLHLAGKGSKTKRIHPSVWEWPKSALKAMLVGWLAADGTAYRVKEKYSTTAGVTASQDLAKGMFDLALGLGYHPALRENSRIFPGGQARWMHEVAFYGSEAEELGQAAKHYFKALSHIPQRREQHIWLDQDGYYLLPISDVYREDYDGDVFDLTITPGSSYVVNGVTVHNCGPGGIPWYGIQQRMLRWQSTHRVPDFEVALLGHFHSFGMWRINRFAVLSSGTPITDDDWALQSLGWESANQTWFFGSSDHHPITWAYGLDWK